MAAALTVHERAERVVSADLEIRTLGPCEYPSPLADRLSHSAIHYVGRADRVLLDDRLSAVRSAPDGTRPAFELAGPRNRVFYDTSKLRSAIVTCGGLCPGLNNVIHGLVMELTHAYGVQDILGFRYGYEGIVNAAEHPPLRLTPKSVRNLHHDGGTILGTSRGSRDAGKMVNQLVKSRVGILFVIGGDGTFRGAMKLVEEIAKRGLPIGVVGECPTVDEVSCGGQCILPLENLNCRACGRPCGLDQTCCDGTCRDMRSDIHNCGACGNEFGALGDSCQDGSCRCGSAPACEPGQTCAPVIPTFELECRSV